MRVTIQKNNLDSQERKISLGFNSREEVFWTTNEGDITKGADPNAPISLIIFLNLETITQSRTIYGVFDFLGDVGGLLDLFRLAAELLV